MYVLIVFDVRDESQQQWKADLHCLPAHEHQLTWLDELRQLLQLSYIRSHSNSQTIQHMPT